MNKEFSILRLIRQSMIHKIWALFLATLAMFFSFPIKAGIYIGTARISFEFNPMLKLLLPRLFRYNVFGEGNSVVSVVTVLLGIFMGIYCFSFLLNQRKVDLFHSLPVRRGVLFLAKYLSGLLSYAIPYVVFLIIAIILGAVNGLMTPYSIPVALYMFGMNLLSFMLTFSTTVVAVMLTGKLPVAILVDALFLGFGPCVSEVIRQYSSLGFFTYYSNTFIQKPLFNDLSPIILATNLSRRLLSYQNQPELGPLPMLAMLACVFVMTLVSYLIYKKRPSEAAGKALSFKGSAIAFELIAVTLLSLCGGLLFSIIASDNGWIFFGVIITAIITHMIYRAIIHGDFKSIIKAPWCLGLSGALAVFIMSSFLYDFFGYDQYIPNLDKLEYAAFSPQRISNGIDYYNFDNEINPYGYYDYYVDGDMYRFEHMKLTDKTLISELTQAAVEDSAYSKQLQKNGYDVEQDANQSRWVNLGVAYKLSSGKTIYRWYKLNLEEHFDLINKLFVTPEYKEACYPILTDETDYEGPLVYTGVFGDTRLNGLTAADEDKLYKTYRRELRSLTLYDMTDSAPLGMLHTYYYPEGEDGSFYSVKTAYIYPCMSETIELLLQYGIDVYEYKNPENIDFIRLQFYDKDWGAFDEDVANANFNQKEDIETILSLGYPGNYSYIDDALHRYGTVDGTIHYTPEYNTDWVVALVFNKENIPKLPAVG